LRRLHPLLIVAVFIVVFLAIHPFQDGNERLTDRRINSRMDEPDDLDEAA
jgi:hypothetical protein